MNKKIFAGMAAAAMALSMASAISAEEASQAVFDSKATATIKYVEVTEPTAEELTKTVLKTKAEQKADNIYEKVTSDYNAEHKYYRVLLTTSEAVSSLQFGFVAADGDIVDFFQPDSVNGLILTAEGKLDSRKNAQAAANSDIGYLIEFGDSETGNSAIGDNGVIHNTLRGADTTGLNSWEVTDYELGIIEMAPGEDGGVALTYDNNLNIAVLQRKDGNNLLRAVFEGFDGTNTAETKVLVEATASSSSSEAPLESSSSEAPAESSSSSEADPNSGNGSSSAAGNDTSSSSSSTAPAASSSSSSAAAASSSSKAAASSSSKAAASSSSKAATTNPNNNVNTGAASTAVVGLAAVSAALVVVSKKRK